MSALLTLSVAAPGQATVNPGNLVELVGRVALPPCTTSDVANLDADHALIARRHEGFAVVDLRNPERPVATTVHPPGYPVAAGELGCGDIKSDGRHIYVTDESVGAGVFIYDAVDPTRPRLVTTLANVAGAPTRVHNCWISDGILYAGDTLVDVRDLSAPRVLAKIGTGFVHDVMVQDHLAYVSLWRSGFEIYDVSQPAVPRRIAQVNYPNALTHNLWPTKDGRTLYSTDERFGSPVGIWDLTDPTDPQFKGSFRGGPNGGSTATAHNVYVRDGLMFIAYYEDGLRVADISQPHQPVEIASYDTYPLTGQGCGNPFSGAWGAYPWRPDLVLVSDLESGLYVLRVEPLTNQFLVDTTTPSQGGVVRATLGLRNGTNVPLAGFSLLELESVSGREVHLPLWFESTWLPRARGTSRTFPLRIPVGIPPGTQLTLRHTTGLIEPVLGGRELDVRITVR